MTTAEFLFGVFLLVQSDDVLSGRYNVVAVVSDAKVELKSTKSTWQFIFEKEGVVTWVNTDPNYSGLPGSGARMNLAYDNKSHPKRLEMWYEEDGGKTTFAYGICEVNDSGLLVKLLIPLGVANNGTEEDVKRFRKSPYPVDFSPPAAQKFEILFVLKKMTDKQSPKPK